MLLHEWHFVGAVLIKILQKERFVEKRKGSNQRREKGRSGKASSNNENQSFKVKR